jgi:hypothetical protein
VTPRPACRARRGALLTAVALIALPSARAWMLRWGATSAEIAGPVPGDDLLPEADLVATRAITIEAGAEDVWGWIAQLGQGRGGFYSYDRLENLVGCDIRSSGTIVPAWQGVAVGDAVHLHPDVALIVVQVEPGRALVLRGAVPVGGAVSPAPPPYDFTWAFTLRDGSDGSTRLVVRERYAYLRRSAALIVEPVSAVSWFMSQRMLRGIRDRAEALARTR